MNWVSLVRHSKRRDGVGEKRVVRKRGNVRQEQGRDGLGEKHGVREGI